MALNNPPLGYTGEEASPPTAQLKHGIVRAAKATEALGTRPDLYISPATVRAASQPTNNTATSAAGGTLAPFNSYIATNASQTSYALPATAAVGDNYLITGTNANTAGWIVTQNAGQKIRQNTSTSTTGASGTVAGAKNVSARIRCVVADTDFVVDFSGAALTFV